YRLMTLGSTVTVLVLFSAALLAGRLLVYATRFAEVLTVLNGLIAILLLLWLANIVVVSGAALDAEFLRARQIASGLDAWDNIALDPHATHTLNFLAGDAAEAEEIGRAVAGSARSGEPLRHARGPWIVDAGSLLAVNPPTKYSVVTRSDPTDHTEPSDPDQHTENTENTDPPHPGDTPA
ncbi:MAG: YihY/virulence factor BrkB family protein, partial [Brachybacterium tyrofermentans]